MFALTWMPPSAYAGIPAPGTAAITMIAAISIPNTLFMVTEPRFLLASLKGFHSVPEDAVKVLRLVFYCLQMIGIFIFRSEVGYAEQAWNQPSSLSIALLPSLRGDTKMSPSRS